MTNYDKSKVGVVTRIYADQKKHSKTREHKDPSYTKEWLQNWLFINPEFHRLFDMWVLSGYDRDYKPSVNRKDDYIGYTEYNIQLMTFRENYKKSHKDMKNGKNSKRNKKVLKCSMDGKVIQEYHSVREAGRATGISSGHISSCCKNKPTYNSSGGFKWKFKKEDNNNE